MSMKVLKIRSGAAVGAVAMAVIGLGAISTGAGQRNSAGATTAESGRQVYVANCAACHGSGGKGNGRAAADFKDRPTDLTDPDFADQSERALIHQFTHAPRPMPRFEGLLS